MNVIARLSEPAIRRPGLAVACAAALAVLALFSVMRLHPDTSLDAMLARDMPAAQALSAIAGRYRALDELLVLVSVPGNATSADADDADALVAFAERCARALEDDPSVSHMITSVRYRLDADAPERTFIADVVSPALLHYADDAQFEPMLQRLTAGGMRDQIKRNETLIAAPGVAADAVARTVLRDPLRLHQFIPPADALVPGATGAAGDAPWIDETGRHLLMRITAVAPANDLDFARRLVDQVTARVERINDDRLDVHLAGAYAIAAHSAASIRADLVRSVIGSIVLIHLVFLLVYRRIISAVLVFTPVAVAILITFGVYGLLGLGLTPVTAVIGAVLAGLGIDYCVHITSHFSASRAQMVDARSAARGAVASVGPRLTVATATSIAGFAAVAMSHVPALQHFALLGSIGLALSLGAAVTILPALLVLADRLRVARIEITPVATVFDRAAGVVQRHRVAAISIAVVIWISALVVIAMSRAPVIAHDDDLTAMHPQPNPPLETQRRIAATFGSVDAMLVHLRADGPEALLRRSYAVDTAVRSASAGQADSSAVSTFGLHTLLPQPARYAARQAQIDSLDADEIVAAFRAVVQDSIFDPAAYVDYETYLRDLVSDAPPPDVATLLAHPAMAALVLPRDVVTGEASATEAICVVSIETPARERGARSARIERLREALAPIDGATLTGLSVVGHDTERAVQGELMKIMTIAGTAMLLIVVIVLRRPVAIALTIVPVAFGLCVLAAAMALAGQGLNLVNLMAIPLLIGIGVDDGIMLTTIGRSRTAIQKSRDIRSSALAITVTSVTTMLAFGSMLATSTPAIQSLGWMTAVGIGACLVAAIAMLVPLLSRGIHR